MANAWNLCAAGLAMFVVCARQCMIMWCAVNVRATMSKLYVCQCYDFDCQAVT